MPSITYSIPLVGAFHHPPAKAVIPLLPMATPLVLDPEPTNLYDNHAVKVLVAPGALPEYELPAIRDTLPQWGMDLDELLSRPLLWLGYVARTHSAAVTEALAACPGHRATLGCTADGKPLVLLELPEEGLDAVARGVAL